MPRYRPIRQHREVVHSHEVEPCNACICGPLPCPRFLVSCLSERGSGETDYEAWTTGKGNLLLLLPAYIRGASKFTVKPYPLCQHASFEAVAKRSAEFADPRVKTAIGVVRVRYLRMRKHVMANEHKGSAPALAVALRGQVPPHALRGSHSVAASHQWGKPCPADRPLCGAAIDRQPGQVGKRPLGAQHS